MRISKKILAIALSVLMAVSMMPFTAFAAELPTTTITEIEAPEGLDVAFKYVTDSEEASEYDSYLADFVISFDKAVDEGEVNLGGAYDAYDNGNWQIFPCPALEAGEEYRLLKQGVSAVLGRDVSMTYREIREDVKEFRCGAAGLEAAGVTITVKLNLYNPETGAATEIESGAVEYPVKPDSGIHAEWDTIFEGEDNYNSNLETEYKFTALDDETSVQESPYKDYLADFVISFDQDIAEGDIMLSGSYQGYNNGEWVDINVPALSKGEKYLLLADGLKAADYDYTFTYEDICTLVKEFYCGAKGIKAAGVTMTVDLKVFEATTDETGRPVPADRNAGVSALENAIEYTFEANDLPLVNVEEIKPENGENVAYKYTALDDENSVQNSAYKDYLADFVISFDQDIAENEVTLSGSYQGYNNGEWVSFNLPALRAGEEYKLLGQGLKDLGYDYTFTYEDICTIVKEFKCAATGNENAKDVTATISLNLYSTADSRPITIPGSDVRYTFGYPGIILEEIEPENGEDVAYKYTAVDDEDSVQNSPYKDYIVDFVISFDKDVAAGDVLLSGSYQNYNNGEWVNFNLPDLAADEEYKLLGQGLKDAGYDYTFTYDDICTIVKEFKCAATGVNANDVTATVKLNFYETADSEPITIPDSIIEVYFFNDEEAEDSFDVWVEDTLDFNLYIQDSRADKVVFEYNGSPEKEANIRKTMTVTKAEAEANDNIYYFTVELAPAQAYDDVTYTVYDADGEVIRTNTTSLAEYLNLVTDNDAYGDLARAIYDYCKAAAEYFNYNADAYEQPYYNEVADFGGYSLAANDTTGKVTGVSYVATSEPALRFSVALTEEEAAALSASSNIGTASFKKRGDDVVLEVKDIPISKLGETITVTVDGLGAVTYTPIIYARNVSTLGNSLATLGIAIANVNQAAAALFN